MSDFRKLTAAVLNTEMGKLLIRIKDVEAERNALQATVDDMREALVEIAPHPHATNLLWWQQIARTTLANHKEQTDG